MENSVADDETMDWMAALKEINRLSKEITQVKKQLKKSNRSRTALTKTNRKLTREEIKLREKNRQLEDLTRIDSLTGVASRRYFMDAFERGADGVLLCGCHDGSCRSREGIGQRCTLDGH